MYELGTLGNRDNVPEYDGIVLDDGSLLSGVNVRENIHTISEEYGLSDVVVLVIAKKIANDFVLLVFVDRNKKPILIVIDNDGNFIHNYGNIFEEQYNLLRNELNITSNVSYPVSTIYKHIKDGTEVLMCVGYLGVHHAIISYIEISGSLLSISSDYVLKYNDSFLMSNDYSYEMFTEYNNSTSNKILRPNYSTLVFYDHASGDAVYCGSVPLNDGNVVGTSVKDNCLFIFTERKVYIYIYNNNYFSAENFLRSISYTYSEFIGEDFDYQQLGCIALCRYNDDSFILGLIDITSYKGCFSKFDIKPNEYNNVRYYDLDYNGVIIDQSKFKDEAQKFYDYYYPNFLDPNTDNISYSPFLSYPMSQENAKRGSVVFFNTLILSGQDTSSFSSSSSITAVLAGIKIEDNNLSIEWIDMSYATSGFNDIVKWLMEFNVIDNKIYAYEAIGRGNANDPAAFKLGVYDVRDVALPLDCGNKYIKEHGSDLGDPYEK